MKGKYRDAESNIEIDSILAEDVTAECLIWQNLEGERVVYKIKKVDKSEDGKIVTFRIIDYNEDFDSHGPVYVKLSYRGTMFRSSIATINKNEISLNFPLFADVKTIEMRGEPRIGFDLKIEKFVTIGVLHLGQLQNEQSLKFQIMDISESGLCVLVSDKNKNFLTNSLNLALIQLGGLELDNPIILSQKYSSPYRYRKDGKSIYCIRVGFELEEKITKNQIKIFIDESF